jgi:hypothetical protein
MMAWQNGNTKMEAKEMKKFKLRPSRLFIFIAAVMMLVVVTSCGEKDGKKYHHISPYSASDGLAEVQAQNGKWGYIDKDKNEVIPCSYFYAGNFVDGFAIVAKGGKEYGIIDKNGEEVLPCKYEELSAEYAIFKKGLVRVRSEDKYGIIDRLGKEIVPCIYDDIKSDSGKSIFHCKLNDKAYTLDFQGNEVVYKTGQMKIDEINIPNNTFKLVDAKTGEELAYRTIELSIKKQSNQAFAPREKRKVENTICVQSGETDTVRFVTKAASTPFADDANWLGFTKYAPLKYELVNDELTIFHDEK